MATWRDYDKLEYAQADAMTAMADFMETLMGISPAFKEKRDLVMKATQAINDIMREARQEAKNVVIKERGYSG